MKASPGSKKRLLVVAPEPPLPAVHGGRVDICNRYQALDSKLWDLALVYWAGRGDRATDDDMRRLRMTFSRVFALELKGSPVAQLTRVLRMTTEPSLVAARATSGATFRALLQSVRLFGPDAIIVESIWPAKLAARLADVLGVPLFIRSHNIEFKYMRTQAELSTGWKRIQIEAARLHLEKYERTYLSRAQATFDISSDDARYWRQQGIPNVHHVPPCIPDIKVSSTPNIEWGCRRHDIAYVGNLWAPNNIVALRWFLLDILPRIRARRPATTVIVAGSDPSEEFFDIARTIDGLTIIENPEEIVSIRKNARVLINPIREGGGVNIKTLEMLAYDSPLVVTPFALAGVNEISSSFAVAGTAEEFADRVIAALDNPYRLDQERVDARRRFGVESAKHWDGVLRSELQRAALSATQLNR